MTKQTKKNLLIKVFLATFFTAVCVMNIFGLMFANDSESSIIPPGSEKGKGSSLSCYVIEGAGSFFKSHSNILLFLNKIELSELEGVDYNELQGFLNASITNLEDAKQSYTSLIGEAEALPYNQEVIGKLIEFDYGGFQEQNDLNASIFGDVKAFLMMGDVKGVYKKILADFEDISKILDLVREKIETNEFPEISDLWKLNQAYARCLLFGQYVAQVFKEIKK